MIFRRLIILTITCLWLVLTFAVTTTHAQDSLECGDEIEDEVDGDPVTYEIEVDEGDFITILLSSDDFDTVVEVYEDGDLMDSNDDGGEGLNSRITIVEEGDYEVVVTGIGGAPEGDYELQVLCAGDCEVYEEELDDDSMDFEFEAEEGNTVLLSVTSDDFDTYLTLLDEDEDEIASDDDGGPGLNSLVIEKISDDGDYIAQVSSYSGEDGDFTLVICEDAGDIDTSDDTDLTDYEILECDSSTDGEITDGFPVIFFLFNAEDDEEVTITLSADRGSSLDTYLGFALTSEFSSEGTVLAENDDTNGTDSEIVYEVEEGETYLILATRYGFADGSSEGDFELEIECG